MSCRHPTQLGCLQTSRGLCFETSEHPLVERQGYCSGRSVRAKQDLPASVPIIHQPRWKFRHGNLGSRQPGPMQLKQNRFLPLSLSLSLPALGPSSHCRFILACPTQTRLSRSPASPRLSKHLVQEKPARRVNKSTCPTDQLTNKQLPGDAGPEHYSLVVTSLLQHDHLLPLKLIYHYISGPIEVRPDGSLDFDLFAIWEGISARCTRRLDMLCPS